MSCSWNNTTYYLFFYYRLFGKGTQFITEFCAKIQLGAALAVGTDVDPQAITSARENAALNNIQSKKLQLYLVPGKVTSPSCAGRRNGGAEGRSLNGMEILDGMDKFDIVISNILLNNLIELADVIVSYAKPGAVVGVSGILSEQVFFQNRASMELLM